MKPPRLLGHLAFGMLLILGRPDSDVIAQSPRVRDHRDPANKPPIRIRAPSGPVVQWQLLTDPVVADQPRGPTATRYRLVSANLQLAMDPQRGQRLQLRPFNAAGMRANVVYHRNASSNGLELNRRFAIYLPDQRAYVVYKKVERSEGEIVIREPPGPGAVWVPSEVGLVEWNPLSNDSRAPSADVFQWELRITGDHRARSIVSQRRRVAGQWYEVTEDLALFNTSTNAYLMYDATGGGFVGWKNR
jgi:hypothetical protein